MTTTLLQSGQIEAAAGDIIRLYLPHPQLFADRARRCRQLATNNPLAGYLAFSAALAEQQQVEYERCPALPLPGDDVLHHCHEHDMPPLAPEGWPSHPQWLEVLHRLLNAGKVCLPVEGQQALEHLPLSDITWLDAQKTALLRGDFGRVEPAVAPFIGAALQVQWSALAARLSVPALSHASEHQLCPVCGSHPLAAVQRSSGPSKGLRYLHCSLCSAQWHIVRAKCSNCGNTQGIEYFSFPDHLPCIQAESCPDCMSYIKLIRQEEGTTVDPLADDLASLALDLRIGEKKYAKTSVNLFFIHPAGHAEQPS